MWQESCRERERFESQRRKDFSCTVQRILRSNCPFHGVQFLCSKLSLPPHHVYYLGSYIPYLTPGLEYNGQSIISPNICLDRYTDKQRKGKGEKAETEEE